MRARRLITALCTVMALVALAGVAQGSAGQPVIQGQSNNAGPTTTSLIASGPGASLAVRNTAAGTALSATTSDGAHYAVVATNGAVSHGAGAALQAAGGKDSGVVASTSDASSAAVRGSNSAPGGKAVTGSASAATGSGIGVLGSTSSPTGYGVYSSGTLGVAPGKVLVCSGCVSASDLAPNAAWRTTGNAGTNPGTNFLGTTDNQPLIVKVHAIPALRIEPTSGTPNLIGGYAGNFASSGVRGATIAGGGGSGSCAAQNEVTDDAPQERLQNHLSPRL